MGVAFRASIYATVFCGIVFGLVPWLVLTRTGAAWPRDTGAAQLAGVALFGFGVAVSGWCAASFVVRGRGTPAPFDAPRRLVVQGPYRFVRNPMYVGAGLALVGAALFYASPALAIYWVLLWGLSHGFVTRYEEPTLRRKFGADYETYCSRVGRWRPRLRAGK